MYRINSGGVKMSAKSLLFKQSVRKYWLLAGYISKMTELPLL